MKYINTNPLWEEMSDIANTALCEIEEVINKSDETNIPTSYGNIYYDWDEEELYVSNAEGEEPLRELNTHDILNIAEEINEYFLNSNS